MALTKVTYSLIDGAPANVRDFGATGDGVSWDPLALAAGRPYWTIWQGDRWRNPGG